MPIAEAAAVTGARTRFRAVMMTSIAFVFGLVPLVIATGAAQISRRSLGTPVFAGMIFASLNRDFCNPVAVRGVSDVAGEGFGEEESAPARQGIAAQSLGAWILLPYALWARRQDWPKAASLISGSTSESRFSHRTFASNKPLEKLGVTDGA